MVSLYPRLHLPDLEDDHSLKISTEAKNAWNYTSTTTYCLIRCTNVHIRLLDPMQFQARGKIFLNSQSVRFFIMEGHKQKNLSVSYYDYNFIIYKFCFLVKKCP